MVSPVCLFHALSPIKPMLDACWLYAVVTEMRRPHHAIALSAPGPKVNVALCDGLHGMVREVRQGGKMPQHSWCSIAHAHDCRALKQRGTNGMCGTLMARNHPNLQLQWLSEARTNCMTGLHTQCMQEAGARPPSRLMSPRTARGPSRRASRAWAEDRLRYPRPSTCHRWPSAR